MTKSLCIISLFIISFSCTNTDVKKEKTSEETKLIFPSLFEGEWVLSEYIKSIEKTLSPVKSANKLKGIVNLSIPPSTNKDTIEIGASYNNHEGYSFRIILEKGKSINSFKTDLNDFNNESNYYEIGYERIKNETVLFLYHYNHSNELIEKIKFTKVKVNYNENDASEGLQQVVNEKIFSGKFLLFDSTNVPINLTFNKVGEIIGHPDFKTYYIFTDFIAGPEPTVDELVLNFRTKKSKSYLFKATKDTIFLFNKIVDGLPGGEPLTFGELKYKLIRKAV